MANTVQARKRARQSEKRRQLNASLRSMVRSAMKKVSKAVAAGDKVAAEAALRESTSVVDRIADKQRILHKNKAARFKSRLAARIKAMA
jgi:small subunit ribosomal protein S20